MERGGRDEVRGEGEEGREGGLRGKGKRKNREREREVGMSRRNKSPINES